MCARVCVFEERKKKIKFDEEDEDVERESPREKEEPGVSERL